ncbi:MAG: hypothetical protein A2268_02395 [Candidatus Raymondbacteria bacterium RifOxyA12_full_50_37]|uniref:Prevent-host-death protein n=1 Tax=Candidatus Raymondbacteria bacterium RIFOXYD12_FULL_49_13 TaxID=1817890 RepID=A0A1F7F3E5_UNCRA|nr:MAG: hypothetical protein A2268_02395 [Candidatus Raymondbacteria bacterium RifOxyA12_full_50_37]OGJ89149.1 MAG: hypothetical protein A2248_11370 [Candidatus Raymondbacteria bacterium RIFOXYA2_FULL_49_16]OGJ96631.1 MAG: hypothetical protein A2453_06485 [Candidatus Raymondbacteria bacterium RIFOXYC2_FULL_50_21]OGK01082.1 MAG: hypothetical protein A2519_16965 [Candidatus Raymondbacteria bacterium RIFOXYD12_FULL_49_13]OGK01431.1 MAG: hypothetical protein A2350_07715 [Candidatus Raymondbacteria 
MDFVASREFRVNPGKVWKRLRKTHKLVVTLNGKPIAMVRDIMDGDLEESMRTDAMAECAMAVSQLQEQAYKKGLNKLSEEDIEKEIAQARRTF